MQVSCRGAVHGLAVTAAKRIIFETEDLAVAGGRYHAVCCWRIVMVSCHYQPFSPADPENKHKFLSPSYFER